MERYSHGYHQRHLLYDLHERHEQDNSAHQVCEAAVYEFRAATARTKYLRQQFRDGRFDRAARTIVQCSADLAYFRRLDGCADHTWANPRSRGCVRTAIG